MADVFKTLLLISCIGSVVGMFLIVSRPFTKKIFSSSWHYYMWLVVLLIMVLPIKINMPVRHTIEDSSPVVYEHRQSASEQDFVSSVENVDYQNVPERPALEKKSEIFTRDNFTILSYIWLIGFFVILLVKVASYLIFCVKLRSKSQIISCPEISGYTTRNVKVRISDNICSPLMVGLFRPSLILPKTEVTEKQLHYILKHETTHLKRQDILYKWFLSFVKCVHWFNPVIYIVSKYINLDCEISCDMVVVKNLNETETKGYTETILTLLSSNNKKQIPLTTGMTGNKKSLKKRFLSIKNKNKVSLGMKAISLIIAVVIIIGAVFVSGIINGRLNLTDNALAGLTTDKRQGDEFNFLMIGVDDREKADTIMVFNYDGKLLTGMIIPKNVDLIYTEDGYTKTISELLTKEDGDQRVIDAVKTLLGIPVHYYARVNIQAVEDMVDSVGGMRFNIPYNMKYDDPAQDLHISLAEGEQLLNGEQTGHLLRFRDRQHPNSDEVRVMTWHSVIKEFLSQIVAENKLVNIPELYKTVTENVKTNYSLDDLLSDAESFKKLDRNSIIIENIRGRNVVSDNGYFVFRINMVESEPLLEVFNSSQDGAKLVSAVTYTNDVMGFQIRLPEKWKGRYEVIQFDNQIEFLHKDIFLKYGKGAGGLFKITRLTPPLDESGEAYDYLHWEKNFAFAWSEYTDVQYPVWDDKDEEDVRLVEEYEDMLVDLEFIKNSFTLTGSQQEAVAEVKTENARKPVKTVAYNDGSVKIKSSQTSDYPYSGFDMLELKNVNSGKIQEELNKSGISKADSSSADLSNNYIAGDYSYKDGLQYNNNVVCDNNGNISVYFDVNTDNLVDVSFYEAETKKDVGGYKILANNQNAYTFMGFDPEKTYIVDVQGETGSSWKIEGEYIIY